MKHTPGPWRWLEDRFRGGYSGIVGKDDQSVLFADHANDGDEGAAWFEEFPSEADRNLIAAAPEMCEVLLEIASELGSAEWGTAEHAEEILHEMIRRYYSRINTILAKAEGKEEVG